ncbi:MAG: GAF domain-containing protein [Nitrospirae bacterium]|nr:GAF domain-containing protein [Nitrospirota bacterium]
MANASTPVVVPDLEGVYYISVPVVTEAPVTAGHARWTLFFQMDVSQYGMAARKRAAYTAAANFVLILGVSFLVSLTINRNISAPLAEIGRAAEFIKTGDYNVRLPVYKRIEFGVLASAFNDMARTLDEREKHITSLNLKLLNIIEVGEKIASEVDLDAVLDRICQSATTSFDLRLAWIGLANGGAPGPPAAWHGHAAGELNEVIAGADVHFLTREPTMTAFKTGQPAVINDAEDPACGLPWHDKAAYYGVGSVAAVPLAFKDDILGVLTLYSDRKGCFTVDTLALLQPMVFQASIAINKAALILKVTKSQSEWETTFDTIPDMVYIHDREYNITRANAATATALGKGWGEIIGKKCYDVFHSAACAPDSCPSCKVLSGGDYEVSEMRDAFGKGLFLLTSSPITGPDGGVERVVHTVKDITALREVDERLREEAFISNSMLKIVDAVSSSMDLDSVLVGIADVTRQLIRCDSVFIYLWDAGHSSFAPGAQSGILDEFIPVFKTMRFTLGDVHFFDRVSSSDRPLMCDLVCDDIPGPIRDILGLKTVTAMPVRRSGGVLGLIVVNLPESGAPFSAREINLLKAIADESAIVIENAKLYSEAQERTIELAKRVETISTMSEIDKVILSTFTKDHIVSTVGYSIRRLIPCDYISIYLSEDDGSFKTSRMTGTDLLTKRRWTAGESLFLARVHSTGKSCHTANLTFEEDAKEMERSLVEAGIKSVLLQPVKAGKRLMAVLFLGSANVAGFTVEDMNNLEKLSYQVAVALENSRLFSELDELFLSTIRAMSMAIEAKSHWTHGHSVRVTEYAIAVAKEMGMDSKALRDLEVGGLLHDVGKIGTYESILDKPGKLTEEEYVVVKQHPDKGVSIVSEIKQLKGIQPIIRHHHERFDGHGYPAGLAGADIPLLARVLALADTYDSIISDRPYRVSPGKGWAVEEIKRCSGSQFDPDVVAAFLRIVVREPFA